MCIRDRYILVASASVLAADAQKKPDLFGKDKALGSQFPGEYIVIYIDDGNKIGDTNNAAAFSFYANKNITTGGEGGAIATNDSKLADRLRMLSLHGMDKDGWSRFKSNGKWSYDISELGYKYNLTDVASIIGIDQLNNINKFFEFKIGTVFRDSEEEFIPTSSSLNKKNSNLFGSISNKFSDKFDLEISLIF